MSRSTIKSGKLNGRDLELHIDAPPDIATRIRAMLADVIHFVPPWLRSLWVVYEGTAPESCPDAEATVNTQDDYRRARIYLHGGFFDQDDNERRTDLLHEIAHIWTEPLAGDARDIIDQLVPDDDSTLREITRQRLSKSVETIVMDLAHLLDHVIHKGHARVPIPKT